MGSKKSVFELMNIKIKHDIRNNANRRTNCDAANIRKTVTASGEQYEAILRLRDSGELEKLPDELRETALLRLENSNASLSVLAALHREPISRSGVNHRLSKLMELADGTEEKTGFPENITKSGMTPYLRRLLVKTFSCKYIRPQRRSVV